MKYIHCENWTESFCEMGIITAKQQKLFLELSTILENLLKLWMFVMKCT